MAWTFCQMLLHRKNDYQKLLPNLNVLSCKAKCRYPTNKHCYTTIIGFLVIILQCGSLASSKVVPPVCHQVMVPLFVLQCEFCYSEMCLSLCDNYYSVFSLSLHVRGMIQNNVDFCYNFNRRCSI